MRCITIKVVSFVPQYIKRTSSLVCCLRSWAMSGIAAAYSRRRCLCKMSLNPLALSSRIGPVKDAALVHLIWSLPLSTTTFLPFISFCHLSPSTTNNSYTHDPFIHNGKHPSHFFSLCTVANSAATVKQAHLSRTSSLLHPVP